MITEHQLSTEEVVDQYLLTHNEALFEILYDRFSGKVFRKCLSILGEYSSAQDATQEIFVKIFTKISTFSRKSKFGTWIYSITYNHCIDFIKYKSKRYSELDESRMEFEETPEISDKEILEIKIDLLKEVLDELRVDDRVILLMKYQDDKSVREIGEQLEMGESAVKMRLKRAKQKARNVLGQLNTEYV